MDLAGRLMSGIKSAAGAGFNLLPDRMNLFARYLTGVGNTNLQLDPSTERSLIQATEIPPMATQLMPTFPNKESAFTGDFSQREMIPLPVPAAGPGIATSGPTMYGQDNQAASQTLGRFNAQVTPTTVRVTDTYDMVNNAEDPDLVSGKFQPGKAYRTLRAAFDPTQLYDPKTDKLRNIGHLLTPEQKNFGNYMTHEGKNQFFSPMTSVGRAAMYALPIKFQPYEIDYTIQRPQ
mgnify:CR=1 FL=1|jgi:hypothetical protein|tara:strand:+ start:555 stop:1256 length:702 start_codon:yes stop_codon:yes gene_type:complete